MNSFRFAFICSCALFFWIDKISGDTKTDKPKPNCTEDFKKGREDFVLNTEESVKQGATYIANPAAQGHNDCVNSCCQERNCNLVLIEAGPEEDSVRNCFLFDCLYRNKFICHFVKKTGFRNYIMDSVYKHYLAWPTALAGKADKPPIANAGPDLVVRPGHLVTLNGIESWDDKKIISYKWELLSGNNSVVTEKTNLPDQLVLSNLQSGVYNFQLKVTDSADQSDATSVTVLVLSVEQSELQCLTPKKDGPCRGSFSRWHYNAASNRCEEFTFGGCKANKNNYLSHQECSDACNGTSGTLEGRKIQVFTEVCSSPCREGQFTCSNGCCLEKGLECDGQRHCSDNSDEESCQHLNSSLAQLLNIDMNEEKARCVDPPITGPCRASMPRWYYDPLNLKCHRFIYGGCSGNKNNFDKKDTCMKACSDVTEKDVFAWGVFERTERTEHHSGYVGTAVVLSVAILALLAVLGYCIQKKRKKESERRCVPTATMPVPLTEDTRHLVYKPTRT
ncbi:kunitz-type protease inhibitor 1-like [Electrophorus electricus]|uniref:Serine peptidase inhibitor, Kunitz type 1 a n=1 Tax=Electrophorus electricus TaxID=8005 RepID=A0A4W4ESE3_ELEEL|nr:kunitz-type protease inhibitor 1-like [Electrophorus electricus]